MANDFHPHAALPPMSSGDRGEHEHASWIADRILAHCDAVAKPVPRRP